MPRHFFSLFAFVSTLSIFFSSAQAALQPIGEAPISSETKFRCQFNADNSTDCVSTYSFTILKPVGRDILSRIDLNYKENDGLILEKAEVIQPGKAPVPLDQAQINSRMAPNPVQGFLNEQQISLAFPNLGVGTRVSYTLREHFSATPSSTQFHYVLHVHPGAVRHDLFDAEFVADRPIFMHNTFMDDYLIKQSADQRHMTIRLRAPRYVNYINEPDNGYIRRFPRLELASSLNPQDHFGPLIKHYNAILANDLPPRSAAAVAAQDGQSAAQKVAALMQHIHEHYRYLGDWRASERGYLPFGLADIEHNGYGDCKDLAVLLTAMLKAAGIEAEPALVYRGQFATSLLIGGMHAPNHAIVRAQIDGQTWWLDPTNPVFAPGRIMADLQQRWALVLGADQQLRQDMIPLETAIDTTRVTRHAQFFDNGNAKVRASVVLSGPPLMQVSVADRQHGRTGTDQQLCQNLARESSDCRLQRAESQFVIPSSYQIDADFVDQRALDLIGGQYFYKRTDLASPWDFFSSYRSQGQSTDIYLGDPQITSYMVSLAGSNIAGLSRSCKARSPWFDIDMSVERKESGYFYRYREVQKMSWVSHEEINSDEFGKLIEKGRTCVDQLQLTIPLVTTPLH